MVTSGAKTKKKKPASKRAPVDSSPRAPSGGPEGEEKKKPRDAEKPKRANGARGGTDAATKVSASVSVILAMVLAAVVNVIAARHYTRWDMTRGGQFTLSDATLETLARLDKKVKVIVLLSKDDPLGVTVAEMLESYGARTNQLEIEHVDPDRDPGKLLEVQKKYGVLAGERGGRVVTDSALILVADDRHHYIAGSDLIKMDDVEDVRAKPRLEQAITGGIRAVLARERRRVCFTSGHDEPSLEVAGTGFAELKERLGKNNLDVAPVFGEAEVRRAPLDGCSMVVLAAPRSPVPAEHVEAIKAFVEGGGDALFVVGPVPNVEQTDWVDLGVADVVAIAGVAVERDLVFEIDPARRPNRGDGEAFFPNPEPHPITQRIVKEAEGGVAPLVFLSSSLRDLGQAQKPTPLLRTSDKALGVVDYWRRAQTREVKPGPDDHEGPLTIATATTLPAPEGKTRGARVVVVGSISPLMGGNWRDPAHLGTALFMESVFSWLTDQEAFLDIPEKPAITTGIKLTEESLTSIFRFVVIAIPFVVLMPGLFIVWLRRRRPSPEAATE
jgi:hypothetical protein